MLKVLITGGAGFIGSHLVEALLKQENQIVVVDNFNNYYHPHLKKHNIKGYESNKLVKIYENDITQYERLKEIFLAEKPDVVVHLAAWAGVRPSIEKPFIYEESNVKGTLNLLELSKSMSIKNFVFASSSSVYGNNHKVPFSEDDPVNHPISPYAATKRSGELLCYTYSHLYSIPISCLRFFTVYGPRQRPEMAIHKFTRLIDLGQPIPMFGEGDTKRDYTYVDDIISGIIGVMNSPKTYEIYNIGNSETVELRYLISMIEKELGREAIINKLPEQPGDVKQTYSDITKLNKLCGYQPKVSIEEGISRFVTWYQENRMMLMKYST